MKNITLSLYYANWCGYSRMFLPDWEKIKTMMVCDENKKLLDNVYNVKATYNQYEVDKDPQEFNEQHIQYYPSLRVTYQDVFSGDRYKKNYEDIIKFINSYISKISINKDYPLKITIEYFSKKGCSWCDKFEPIWNSLKEDKNSVLKKIKYPVKESDFVFVERDEEYGRDKVDSYPTIFITYDFFWTGQKDFDTLLNLVQKCSIKNEDKSISSKLKNNCSFKDKQKYSESESDSEKNIQTGGSFSSPYYQKYLKYKQKYLDLKNKL